MLRKLRPVLPSPSISFDALLSASICPPSPPSWRLPSHRTSNFKSVSTSSRMTTQSTSNKPMSTRITETRLASRKSSGTRPRIGGPSIPGLIPVLQTRASRPPMLARSVEASKKRVEFQTSTTASREGRGRGKGKKAGGGRKGKGASKQPSPAPATPTGLASILGSPQIVDHAKWQLLFSLLSHIPTT